MRGEVLSIFGGIELNSNHPLAECILLQAKEEGAVPAQAADFSYTSGKGAQALVNGKLCGKGPDRSGTVRAGSRSGGGVRRVRRRYGRSRRWRRCCCSR